MPRTRSQKSRAAVFATLAVVATGVTALPLLPVWLNGPDARPAAPVAASATTQATLDGDLVVDLRDDVTPADVQAIERRFGITLAENAQAATEAHVLVADLNDAAKAEQIAHAMTQSGDTRIEAAEPEATYTLPADLDPEPDGPTETKMSPAGTRPNDPRYDEQWNFKIVGAEGAWERTRGRGVVVAVIDTGVAAKTTSRGKQARDFNKTKFVKGYDFVNDDDDPYDDHAHGTHVAGTIAESTNNHEGVAGLAFESSIMPIKVLSAQGSGTVSAIADAIRWAADHGANVINMSLGGPYPSAVMRNAVKYAHKKGVTVVCAAGNGFGGPVGYPAAYPECIAVSSVGPTGEIAKYSSYGKEVALAAPGGDMIESGNPADGVLQNTIYPEEQGGRGDDYYAFQGTSMASPHAAAVAALVIAQGEKDPERVREVLKKTATPKNDPIKYGAGVLSADRATAKMAGLTTQTRAAWTIVGALALGLLVLPRRLPFGMRVLLAGALLVGYAAPSTLTNFVGANSAWNLLATSALVPFLLLWELEGRWGSRIVALFSLGVAGCTLANLITGLLPFTPTVFGNRPLAFVVVNLLATVAIGAIAWRRATRSSSAW